MFGYIYCYTEDIDHNNLLIEGGLPFFQGRRSSISYFKDNMGLGHAVIGSHLGIGNDGSGLEPFQNELENEIRKLEFCMLN